MSFAFEFSGDDIINGEDQMEPTTTKIGNLSVEQSLQMMEIVQAKRENFDEMLSSLPSSISYSTILLKAPKSKQRILIPRRALFDIRMQVMAESEDVDDDELEPAVANSTTRTGTGNDVPRRMQKDAGLGDSDIEQNVYEGGFKSWEGAMDLALLLMDGHNVTVEGHGDSLNHFGQVVELGCGTALPSLILFSAALEGHHRLNLIAADYNSSVLRLVTLPNLLLVWALHHARDSFSPRPPLIPLGPSSVPVDSDGELDVTPSLLSNFRSSLTERGIELAFLSGPWSPSLLSLLPPLSFESPLLVLAAETIYQPTSLPAFVETLEELSRRSRHAKALIAAKKVYFGVGGGVQDIVSMLAGRAMIVHDLSNSSGIAGCDANVGAGGVARWIGQVTLMKD